MKAVSINGIKLMLAIRRNPGVRLTEAARTEGICKASAHDRARALVLSGHIRRSGKTGKPLYLLRASGLRALRSWQKAQP